jgi:hypothetical protein
MIWRASPSGRWAGPARAGGPLHRFAPLPCPCTLSPALHTRALARHSASHVVILLVKKYPTYKIVNFDKLDYCSSLKNLAEIEAYPNYCFVKGDITSSDLVNFVLEAEKVDTIMHFAAQTHVGTSRCVAWRCTVSGRGPQVPQPSHGSVLQLVWWVWGAGRGQDCIAPKGCGSSGAVVGVLSPLITLRVGKGRVRTDGDGRLLGAGLRVADGRPRAVFAVGESPSHTHTHTHTHTLLVALVRPLAQITPLVTRFSSRRPTSWAPTSCWRPPKRPASGCSSMSAPTRCTARARRAAAVRACTVPPSPPRPTHAHTHTCGAISLQPLARMFRLLGREPASGNGGRHTNPRALGCVPCTAPARSHCACSLCVNVCVCACVCVCVCGCVSAQRPTRAPCWTPPTRTPPPRPAQSTL